MNFSIIGILYVLLCISAYPLHGRIILNQLFRKKTLNLMLAHSEKKELSRTMSLMDLIFLGVGCVIGTGIFVVTGVVAAESAGPGIMLSFVIAGIACALAASVMPSFPPPYLSQEVCIRTHMPH